jgi:ankyrin repeat protein
MVRLSVPFAIFALLLSGHMTARADCSELMQNYRATKQQLAPPQLNTLLARAAREGCLSLVAELLSDGATVAGRGRLGDTALHHAARAAEPEVVAYLLAQGADIEQRKLNGETTLTIAIQFNRPRTAMLLLERGADPNAPGKSEASPLIVAAYSRNEQIVQVLLGRGADKDTADKTGKTAIVYAAALGLGTMVEQLLATGVSVNARYGNELTVLMWAAGHAEDVRDEAALATVQLLVSKGARLDDVDNRGRSAIMIAAVLGHADIVAFLRGAGAATTLRDLAGATALDLAANDTVRNKLTADGAPRSDPGRQ